MGVQKFGRIVLDPEDIEYFEDFSMGGDRVPAEGSHSIGRLVIHLKSGRVIDVTKQYWLPGDGKEYDAFKAHLDELLKKSAEESTPPPRGRRKIRE